MSDTTTEATPQAVTHAAKKLLNQAIELAAAGQEFEEARAELGEAAGEMYGASEGAVEMFYSALMTRAGDLRDAFIGFNGTCYDDIEAVVFRVMPMVEFAEKAEREFARADGGSDGGN